MLIRTLLQVTRRTGLPWGLDPSSPPNLLCDTKHLMFQLVPHLKNLPGEEERRQIRERAGAVLAEARALADVLDRQEGQTTWILGQVQAHPNAKELARDVRPY
jgi:hypothetical protein